MSSRGHRRRGNRRRKPREGFYEHPELGCVRLTKVGDEWIMTEYDQNGLAPVAAGQVLSRRLFAELKAREQE